MIRGDVVEVRRRGRSMKACDVKVLGRLCWLGDRGLGLGRASGGHGEPWVLLVVVARDDFPDSKSAACSLEW